MFINLRQFIKIWDGLDLGVRFDIVKKFVDIVYMMYVVDWVYKYVVLLYFKFDMVNCLYRNI